MVRVWRKPVVVDDRHICILHGSNDLYGASRVLIDDVAVLTGLGYRVSVVCPAEGPLGPLVQAAGADFSVEPLSVIRRVARNRDMLPPIRLPEAARTAGTLVLWTLALVSYLPAARLSGKRVVTSVHEILEGRAGSFLGQFACAGSSALMTNSKTTREWLTSTGPVKRKVPFAYPAAPAYRPLPARKRDVGSLRALLGGRVNGHKGHLEAVHAGRMVREKGLNFELVLAGGVYPGQEMHLERLLAEIANERWVDYVGEVADLQPLMANVDVVLVPTTRPEPFGVVALEAWSAGRRVIGANEGGLAEAVELVDGLEVPARDVAALASAMVEASEDPGWVAAHARVSEACTIEARSGVWVEILAGLEKPRRFKGNRV